MSKDISNSDFSRGTGVDSNERDLKFFSKNLLKIIDPAYKFHPEILTRTTTAVKKRDSSRDT